MDDHLAKPLKAEALQDAIVRWCDAHTTAVQGEADTEDASLAPIDHNQLLEIVEGDAAAVAEILQLFLEDSVCRIAALGEAITRGDLEEVQRLAHALKGSCGNVGAERLRKTAWSLEHADSTDVAAGLLADCHAELERVTAFLRGTP